MEGLRISTCRQDWVLCSLNRNKVVIPSHGGPMVGLYEFEVSIAQPHLFAPTVCVQSAARVASIDAEVVKSREKAGFLGAVKGRGIG